MSRHMLHVYSNNKDGSVTVNTYTNCPRKHKAPTPCVGCSASGEECDVSALFKGTIKEPGYGRNF